MAPPMQWTGAVAGTDKVYLTSRVTITPAEGKPLGMTVGGGKDEMLFANDPAFYVSHIEDDEASPVRGLMAINDRIISINGTPLDGMKHDEAIAVMVAAKATGTSFELEIQRAVAADAPTHTDYFYGRHGFTDAAGNYVPGTLEDLTANTRSTIMTRASSGGYGLAMTGTAADRATDGVFIAAVIAGGAAAATKVLQRGHQIVEVNGWNTTQANHNEIRAIFQAPGTGSASVTVATDNAAGFQEFVNLTFQAFYSPSLPPDGSQANLGPLRKIVLPRTAGQSLGFVLCGPPQDADIGASGVFVSAITEGGLAHADNRLRVEDEILEINGCALTGATLTIAAAALGGDGDVSLLVQSNPDGYKYFSEQSLKADAAAAPAVAAAQGHAPTAATTVVEQEGGEGESEAEAADAASEVRQAALTRAADESFGFGVIGGEDAGAQDGGVFVSVVNDGGVAQAAGTVRLGDELVQIDDKPTAGLKHDEVAALIGAAGESITLGLRANPRGFRRHQSDLRSHGGLFLDNRNVRLVEIKGDANGLGFECRGYDASQGPKPAGVFVSKATPDSGLKVGDQILEVSTVAPGHWVPVRYASAEDTINAIVQTKAASGSAYVTVLQNLAGYAFHSNVVATGGFNAIFGEVESLEEVEGEEGGVEGEVPAVPTAVAAGALDLNAFPERPFFVRTFFSQPGGDGKLAFAAGDILQVTNIIDASTWMASSVASGLVGTIPSKSAYEHAYRDSAAWAGHAARANAVAQTVSPSKARTVDDARLEAMQVHSYDVVERRTSTTPRPVAVYGAFAETVFGKVVAALGGEYTLAQPVRSTTRPIREGEKHDVTYTFVTKAAMEAAMDNNAVVEVGSFRENYYGTTVESVTALHSAGKLVVLTVQPPAVRRLAALADLHPVVIFVDSSTTPADCDATTDAKVLTTEVRKAADQDDLYKHIFTHRIALGKSLQAAVNATVEAIRENVTGEYWATLTDVALPLTQPSDENEHVTHDFKTCLIARTPEGKFGFKIAGGVEDGGLPSIVIDGPQPNVVGGSVSHGDMILRINERSAVGVAHHELVNMVARSDKVVRLTLVPPLNRLHSVHLKKSKKLHGFGFSLVSLDDRVGRRVQDIVPKSPAAVANMKEGDCIVAINGKPLLHATHDEILALLRSNKEVTLLLAAPPAEHTKAPLRGVSVTVEKDPSTGYGIRVATNPDWEYPEIESVQANSPAARAGSLRRGQKIMAVNGHSMKKADHAYVLAALRSADKVVLTVSANREIVLAPNQKGFGMSIVFDEAAPNGYPLVGTITPGGAAAESGVLSPGDEIVEINGRSTKGLGEATIFQRLTERPTLALVTIPAGGSAAAAAVEEPATAAAIRAAEATLLDRRTVTLERGSEGLGLIIASDDGSVWTKVCEFVPGTPGARSGININDVLIKVNGVSMVGKTHNQVVAALTEKSTVEMEVAKARRRVRIDNTERAFGLRILGAASKEMFPVVSNVTPGSASAEAHMQPGSHIFSINGIDMRGAVEADIVSALQQSEDHVVVMVTTLEPPTFDEDLLHNVRGCSITRGASGLGLKFVTDDAESFSVITEVLEGSPAAECGAIKENDVIVKVNGAYMTNKSHEEIVDALMASPTVNLIVADHPVPGSTYEGASIITPLGGPRTVTIPKGENGYGIQFSTYPVAEQKLPVVVEVIKGGSAANTEMHPGDSIVEINGTPCRGLEHDAVLDLIRAGDSEVTMLLLHQLDGASIGPNQSGSPHAVDADTAMEMAAAAPSRPKRVTSLRRTQSGYGVKMTTVDGMSHPVVTGIVEGTSAHKDGKIQPGDIILEINGENVAGKSHEEVVAAFTAKDTVDLVVASGEHAQAEGARMTSEPAPATAAAAPAAGPVVGSRVFVIGYSSQGTVRFVGPHHIQGTPRVLVQLDEPEGKNNGTIKGHKYCEELPANTGVLAIPQKVFVVPEDTSPAARLRTVTLARNGGPLGLKLSTSEVPGEPTTVIEVNEGGAALASGLVSVGDFIVTINGDVVYGADHSTVLSAIKASPDAVEFGLFGVPPGAAIAATDQEAPASQPFDMAAFPFHNTLSLKREPGQRLGMSLSSVEGEPISVIDITDGALVAQSQMVNVGDVVVAVNGENMLPVPGESSEQTHAKCVSALSNNDSVSIVFASKKEAYRIAKVTRGATGLGMKISSVDSTFRVSDVVAGGAAEASGAVQKGDRIIAINGTPTADKTHDEVVGLLTASTTVELRLVPDASDLPPIEDPVVAAAVPSPAPAPGEFETVAAALTAAAANGGEEETPAYDVEVTLHRGNSGLGMKIFSVESCFRISDVIEGGAAASTQQVQKGDRIVAVNGTPTADKTHDEVVGLLTASTTVKLALKRDDSPLPEAAEVAPAAPAPTKAEEEPKEEEPKEEPKEEEPKEEEPKKDAPVPVAEAADSAAPAAADSSDIRTVTIAKAASGSLGLKIASLDSVFRVSDVIEGGAAAATNDIKVGDVILSVNGTATADLSHEKVIALLVANDPVVLRLQADESPLPVLDAPAPAPAPAPATKTVKLVRGPSGLGMKISSIDGLFRVSAVIPDGAAEQTGAIEQGDRILSVNGTATAGLAHEEVVPLLTAGTDMELVLQPDESPLPDETTA